MMLTDLATACRKSGLKVVEVDGWKTRGHGQMLNVKTIVCHHTATSKSAKGDYPSLGIVRDGRPGLPGPLAQLGLGRDGTVYVVAAGVCYHAGATFETRQNNWNAIGIEAEHDGVSAWPADLVTAYARLVRALVDHYKVPIANVQGHKEVAKPLGRKVDPNFDMTAFRERVRKAKVKPKPPRLGVVAARARANLAQRYAKIAAARLSKSKDPALIEAGREFTKAATTITRALAKMPKR